MLESLDLRGLSPAAAQLCAPRRLLALGPGPPNEAVFPALRSLRAETLFDQRPVVDRAAAQACLAALWLYHDFFDESHAISQEIDTPEGSYWHGILHRREPDHSNAKYWFRRVGSHPVHEPLARAAAMLASQRELDGPARFLADAAHWEAFAFVDLCQAVARGQSQCEDLARAVQMQEWELLFDYCRRKAIAA